MNQSYSYRPPKYYYVIFPVQGIVVGFFLYVIGDRLDFIVFKILGLIFGPLLIANGIFMFLKKRSIEVTEEAVTFPAIHLVDKDVSIRFDDIFEIKTEFPNQKFIITRDGRSRPISKEFMEASEYESLLSLIKSRIREGVTKHENFKWNRIKERILLPFIYLVPLSTLLVWMTTIE